ncbi:hypothetical protein E2C01_101528 [Portunus trituberculatus]|uniref:Uncharacterized protein n=1 Tax=Portunus trituberculatus TaxID=210409 RepID=A0A5B7KFY9_PORTR|nr:hypothetical protein [Portunus trituberculatus]
MISSGQEAILRDQFLSRSPSSLWTRMCGDVWC